MASTKRKQDEKNLKILRELVSQPGNKECFDCHQRGPTYVNMTIGSFVCTSCSGLLRGLTPPHRVKSISMATFTAAEINFITQRGNEYCKGIWLGSMNPGDSQPLDTKDEQKIKDLMIAKYELKRYYLEPPSEDRNQRPSQKTETLTKSSISRVPLPIMSTLSNSKTNITETKNLNDVTGNFIADFSKAPESCLTPATVDSKLGSSGMMQASFANFDNNPAFSASANTPLVQMSLHHNTGTPAVLHMNETSTAPSEDRYAALKDLDFLMKQTQLKDEATTTEKSSNAWNTNNSNLSNTVWGTGNQSRDVINNPFSNIDIWPTSTNLFNNNFYPDTTLTNSVNPFKSEQNSVNIAGTNVPDSQWTGTQPPNLTNVIQYNQLRTPFVNKVWQPTVPSYHANPFLVGTGMNNVTNNSNNPFL